MSLVFLAVVLLLVFFVVRERRASGPSPMASTSIRSCRRVGRHAAYDIPVGSSKETLLRRLGQPSGGRSSAAHRPCGRDEVAGFGALGDRFPKTEYWLYEDTPRGHNTLVVISARGLVASLEVVPRPGNPRGVARHVVSAPGRLQPMAALWAADREVVLGDPETTARALAEFAETFEIERVEHGLTESQKSRRLDRTRLDEALDDGSPQPTWLLTPLAIRRIGRELDRRGGFRGMQDTVHRARQFTEYAGAVGIVSLLWDRIGQWEH